MGFRAMRRAVVLLLVLAAPATAQTPRLDPAGVPGALLVCGGEVSEAAVRKFIDLAGGEKAKIVMVGGEGKKSRHVLVDRLSALTDGKVVPREVAARDAVKELKFATGAWFFTGHKETEKDLRDECLALLKRPGVIGVANGSTAILGSAGLDLLPLVEVRADDSKFVRGQVAFAPQRGAALLIKGRTLSTVGDGATHLYLAASKTLPARTIELEGKAQEDLTALRRAALDRLHDYPPKTVEPPVVPQGALYIIGGAGPAAVQFKQLVELAGGKGKAIIVALQTAAPDPLSDGTKLKEDVTDKSIL